MRRVSPRPLTPQSCRRFALVHVVLERLAATMAVLTVLIGILTGGQLEKLLIVGAGYLYFAVFVVGAFVQPASVIGLGRGKPTWPLEPLALAPVVSAGFATPLAGVIGYSLAYFYARTLGRRLSKTWFKCDVETAWGFEEEA